MKLRQYNCVITIEERKERGGGGRLFCREFSDERGGGLRKERKVKVAQLCMTLCDPTHCSVHGILQARILEWVAFPFSRGSFEPRSPTLQVDFLPAEPQGKPRKQRKTDTKEPA